MDVKLAKRGIAYPARGPLHALSEALTDSSARYQTERLCRGCPRVAQTLGLVDLRPRGCSKPETATRASAQWCWRLSRRFANLNRPVRSTRGRPYLRLR